MARQDTAHDALHDHSHHSAPQAGPGEVRPHVIAGMSAAAGVLALAVLGARDWPAHLGWACVLVLAIGVHLWTAGMAGAAAARASGLLHAATWGALAWVSPGPGGADLLALMLLQGGVAIAGCLLLLADRRLAIGFALIATLPLTARLIADPGTSSRTVILSLGVFALLLAALWLTGARQAQEHAQRLAAQRAQSLQAGRASDAHLLLARVFEQLGEGICIFDAELMLRAANPRIGELLGLPAALLAAGTPAARWLHHLAAAGEYGSSALDLEAEVARRLAEISRPVGEVARRRRPDGRMIETRRTPLPEGGFGLVCVDITECVASQAALFENQRTLDVLLQRTEEGFWFIDNQQRTTDANPAMCRMLGVEREALLGRPFLDFVDPACLALARAQIANRELGRADTYELTLRRADGTPLTCVNSATPIYDAQGRKIGGIGLFTDLTHVRAAEAAAQRAQALAAQKSRELAHTLDSLEQGVLGFDAGLRLHSWNRRALELLELPPDLVERRPTLAEIGRWQQAHGAFGDAMELIDDPLAQRVVQRQIDEDGVILEAPHRYRRRRPDGRVLDVRMEIGTDGHRVRTYTDVTREVQAAQAMAAARDEAEQANRAKSEFLSRMSHELRTPLNAILGFAQLMDGDRSEPLGDVQRQRLAQVTRGGQHLLALVNEVLDLSHIETGSLQITLADVDADLLADDCLGMLADAAQARPVHLHAREGSAGAVRADEQRLRQVLLNLLTNAIQYNQPGGAVVLRCRTDASVARFEVHDTGPGLDDAQQERLFKPFERLAADRDAVDGTGVGLALCRSLVELMGGRIGVHSAPGQGSCFWFELPRPAAHTLRVGPLAQPDPAPAASAVRSRRVLYIEDNPVNQLLMQGMLAHRPQIELSLADSAESGLAAARVQAPELVLMDIQLPGASGFEALQALRAEPTLRRLPVLAVSANAMSEDMERAQAAGFDGYLTKPLDLQDLLAAVDRWLAGPPPA